MDIGARIAAWIGGKKLPYKRRLEWIRCNGNQWINTGISHEGIGKLCSGEAKMASFEFADTGYRDHNIFHFFNSMYGGYYAYWRNDSSTKEWRACNSEFNVEDLTTKDWVVARQTRPFSMWGKVGDSDIRLLCQEFWDYNAEKPRISNYYNQLMTKWLRVEDTNGVVLFHAYPVIDHNGVPCFYDEIGDRFVYSESGDNNWIIPEGITTLNGGGYKCLILSLKSLWRRFSRVLRNSSKEVSV